MSFAVNWGHSTFKKRIWNNFYFIDFDRLNHDCLSFSLFINSDPVITFFFLSHELVESRWSPLPSPKAISSHSLFKIFFPITLIILNWQLSMVLTSKLCSLQFDILVLRITWLALLGSYLPLATWQILSPFLLKMRKNGFCKLFYKNCFWYSF